MCSNEELNNGLIIVESPAKAKTLTSFFGKKYKVIASYGHIRDLVPKDGSVKPEDHYKMLWEYNERGKKQIDEISKYLEMSDNLYLATDPDREGEAISWHILEVLKERNQIKNKQIKRVVFHEITKAAVYEAFKTPRELDHNLVGAYLARRILDYLVGFNLSPVLWRKMPGARSAGRVQSVALRIIVERELEIMRFKEDEYWTISANVCTPHGSFDSELTKINGNKLEKFEISDKELACKIKNEVEERKYKVEKIERTKKKRNPNAPYTTSTLQQDAVRKLGFTSKKTMQVAQHLYEGIMINGTMTGLITYMRTDSTNLSNEAISESREYINEKIGEKYLPKEPMIYKTKTRNAQEAHEAIRPTSFYKTPDSIKDSLSTDEYELYKLIWTRAISSQMEAAIISQVDIYIESTDKRFTLKATGSTIEFDGFLKVYNDSLDENIQTSKKENKLPKIEQDEQITLGTVTPTQHFTQPPARYNEASLVKKLEELGIGRPSTYATIISVLQSRKYVTIAKKVFKPEQTGYFAVSFLKNYFTKYIEYDFTADMEKELDEIANGKLNWEKVLDKFCVEFNKAIETAKGLTITEVINNIEEDLGDYIFKEFGQDRICPSCRKGKLHLKFGRYGAFIGCSEYPDCKNIIQIGNNNIDNKNAIAQNEREKSLGIDERYENDKILLKRGPYGYYLEWQTTKDPKDETGKKPKRKPIPKFILEPTELTIGEAITLDRLPIALGEHPKSSETINLCLGRLGPYLKIGKKSYALPKDVSFLHVTLNEAIRIIDEKDKTQLK